MLVLWSILWGRGGETLAIGELIGGGGNAGTVASFVRCRC